MHLICKYSLLIIIWCLMATALFAQQPVKEPHTLYKGAVTRGDSTQKKLYLVFTGDEFADGGDTILSILHKEGIKASFFFTGRFYNNPAFNALVRRIKKAGHYLGAHSDEHLLYCDWHNRDSLLVTQQLFTNDLMANYKKMKKAGIKRQQAPLFLPSFEWYNDSIAAWTRSLDLQLINYTPGTLSHADYTIPTDKNYRSSEDIFRSVVTYENQNQSGLNGFILLMHIGTDIRRSDKFYYKLADLIHFIKENGYKIMPVTALLN